MLAEIEVDVAGRRVRLAAPLGALERIAKVNPMLEEVRDSFAVRGAMGSRVWRLDELRAVLAAGLEAGGGMMTAEAFIDAVGLARAREAARDLMNAAFRDDAEAPRPGKDRAEAASPTASASGSS